MACGKGLTSTLRLGCLSASLEAATSTTLHMEASPRVAAGGVQLPGASLTCTWWVQGQPALLPVRRHEDDVYHSYLAFSSEVLSSTVVMDVRADAFTQVPPRSQLSASCCVITVRASCPCGMSAPVRTVVMLLSGLVCGVAAQTCTCVAGGAARLAGSGGHATAGWPILWLDAAGYTPGDRIADSCAGMSALPRAVASA